MATYDEPVSFEQDVAPRTSSFFRSVQESRFLRPEQRSRIADQFFGDVVQIRNARDRMQSNRLGLLQQQNALEESRFAMERARKRAEDEDALGSVFSTADAEVESILADETLTPEEKASELQYSQFKTLQRLPASQSSAGSWLSRKYGAAMGVVKPQMAADGLTPSAIARAAAMGVPAEVFDTNDPVVIGQAIAQVQAQREQQKAQYEAQEKEAVEARRAETKYLDALNSISGIDPAFDDTRMEADPTKFKGGEATLLKVKRALGMSPDPVIRQAAADAGDDAVKLREVLRRTTAPPTPSRPVLPPRPR